MHTKHKSHKKLLASMVAIVLVLALLIGGAFAWTDFSQFFINRFRGGANNDALLHDDFDPSQGKKDIYVENTGETEIVVRVRLDEFLQIGNKTVVAEAPHLWGVDSNVCKLATHDYFDWNVSGDGKIYLHGTSEIGYEDYTGKNPEVDEGPNGQKFGETAPSAAPVLLDDFLADRASYTAACWVLDPVSGWAYWSQMLKPGEATNMLLNGVTKKTTMPDDNYYYTITAKLEATNATELYKMTGPSHPWLPEEEVVDTAYAIDLETNRALHIDIATGEVLRSIQFDDSTTMAVMVVVPELNKMYVLPVESYGIAVVDLETFTVSKMLDDYGRLIHYAYNPTAQKLYLTDEDSRLSIIDVTDDTAVAELSIPDGCLAVDAVANRIFAVTNNDKVINIIDGDSDTIIDTLPISAPGLPLVDNVSGKLFIFSHEEDKILLLDLDDLTQQTDIPLSFRMMRDVKVNSATGKMYVSDIERVAVVSSATGTVNIIPLAVDNAAFMISVDEENNLIYISSFDDVTSASKILVVDGETDTILHTITVDGAILYDIKLAGKFKK